MAELLAMIIRTAERFEEEMRFSRRSCRLLEPA